ncbi:restriction endonuclease subunit S [Psychromicrobium silvestre]
MTKPEIPSDWSSVLLGEIATVSRGASPRPIASSRWFSDSSNVGWVRIADLGRSDGLTLLTTTQRLSPDGVARSRFLQPGSLIMSIAATVGLPIITGIPACIHDGFVALERLRGANKNFLLYALKAGESELRSAGQTGSQSNVNTAIVKGLRIALPPEPEQERIAEVLADVDRLISSLNRVIAKKKAIKQGVMQQLLTHRADRADMTSLGSVTSWLSGGTPNRSNTSYWSGDIPWISATTLKKLEAATSDQLVTPAAVKAGSKMAPLGSTLLLVRGSALHSEIRASLVTGTVCFNQDVKALVPSRNLVPKFLTYSIHGNADRLLRLVTSAGNTAGVLDTQVVKNFQIWMPDRSEQQRLVTLLDDISSEIDVLVSRLVKVTAAKQGMMQELLTGRTRLQSAEVTP